MAIVPKKVMFVLFRGCKRGGQPPNHPEIGGLLRSEWYVGRAQFAHEIMRRKSSLSPRQLPMSPETPSSRTAGSAAAKDGAIARDHAVPSHCC
jgi:hypothetical protein